MAEAAFSATERALEDQRVGALQIGVVAICTLIQMCDGYDVGSIGWAVPSLTHVWNLPPLFLSACFFALVAATRDGAARAAWKARYTARGPVLPGGPGLDLLDRCV
jgi:hypothetical protein